MKAKTKKYGGARTNARIIKIREADGISRADIARLTFYSRGVVDNWLTQVGSQNWRRAPERAVVLLEFQTGRRQPARVVLPLQGDVRHG